MSDPKLVSPLLDGFVLGDPMSSHDGVICCPAIRENSDEKHIVKIISVPESQRQLDALLLTGAYKDPAAAAEYFKELAGGIVEEAKILHQLSRLEGFLPYSGWQVEPMEGEDLGFKVYLLGPYKRSLEKYLRRNPMTHLGAVNLGLDLCAALAICRRSGHMFVDLKPGNIYLTGDREYRIGDLGFVKLSSLKYTSLPKRYRSAYTPPELRDDLATLNPTTDIYAVGSILYQIYNNGQLPTPEQLAARSIPAPLNADYEMAEIILKACAPNPRHRYQTPIEMGQALVSYMQRNTVNDIPIAPPPADLSEEPAAEAVETAEEPAAEAVPLADETLPEAMSEELPEEVPVTEELSSMLDQADDLLADPVPTLEDQPEELQTADEPEPAAVPEAALPEITVPTVKDEDDEDWAKLLQGGLLESDFGEDDDDDDDDYFFDEPQPGQKKKSAKGLLIGIVAVLLLALLGLGGYYYYQNFYLLPIENMSISGYEDAITVKVTTDVDTSILQVVCTDSYGNTLRAPIENGTASFSDLTPDTQYKITVEHTKGFHQVCKSYTGSYSTGKQTGIVDFAAKTGLEDGAVILSFGVNGPEPQEWVMEYVTDGEPSQNIVFTGHTVTITGLSVGKMYTFTLLPPPGAEQWIAGTTTLQFAAARMVVAENVAITGWDNGVLTAQWNAPADITVNSWTVRCYSENGFDQLLTVTEPIAHFENVTADGAYTVEVWAEGMAQSARAYLSENPTKITGITAEPSGGDVEVSWTFEGVEPADGWLLLYSTDGGSTTEVVTTKKNSGTIKSVVPNTLYDLTVQNADGSTVFSNKSSFTTPAAEKFNRYGVNADKVTASLALTPEKSKWTYKDVKDAAVTAFAADAKGILVLHSTKNMYYPDDPVEVLLVIRDQKNPAQPLMLQRETTAWNSIWKDRYCTLALPGMPAVPGDYTVEVYFGGAFAAAGSFTVTE